MPVGFFDDPELPLVDRTRRRTCGRPRARTPRSSTCSPTGADRADEAGEPAQRRRSGLQPVRPRRARSARRRSTGSRSWSRSPARRRGRTAARPEPSADAPRRPDELRAHARGALQRPSARIRRGHALVGVERAEPQLFLTPQFNASGKIVSPQDVREALDGGVHRDQGGQPDCAQVAAGETSNRGHNHPTGSPRQRLGRAGDVREPRLRRPLRTCRSSRGPSIRTRRFRIRSADAEGHLPRGPVDEHRQVRRVAAAVVPPAACRSG